MGERAGESSDGSTAESTEASPNERADASPNERADASPNERAGARATEPRSDPDGASANRLVVWSLATANVCLVVLVPVLAAHATGVLADLLSGLSTLAGVAAFAYLWVLAVVAVRWALSRTSLATSGLGTLALHAFVAGGAVGGGFVLGVGVAVVAFAAVTPDLGVGEVALFAAIVAAVATLVGGLVGLVLGSLNLAGYRLAGRIVPPAASADPDASGDE